MEAVHPHDLIPPATHNRVDAYVQRWVAGTNGNLYIPLINKLPRYPIPAWPGPSASPGRDLLLDVGCGWGRWMIAAARAGYRPVGIDVKLEPVQAARRVMQALGVHGHVVVADLTALPFREGVFDCVFSYSVVQHVHKRKAAAFVAETVRVLKSGSVSFIEYPLKHGLTNFRRRFQSSQEDDPDSWCVRYYGWRELKSQFRHLFGNARLSVDCFFGIGVRREDLDLLPWKYKLIVVVSQILKQAARLFPPLRWLADSVFVCARKTAADPAALNGFKQVS